MSVFGIDAGRMSPKTNAFDVPRIEVMRGDRVWKREHAGRPMRRGRFAFLSAG